MDDETLIREFVAGGREDAFRALAARYAGLVFGTALRIAREHAAAEEISQNVFIVLARKAPFLPKDAPLNAWLHRTAVLEAKNWVRAEARRRQREQTAGGSMNEREESLLQELAPVLDEALLDLREKDRTVLLKRFVEQQDLRQVGRAMGVSEDAAQKRVGKALESLARAFRKRGFSVPGAAFTASAIEAAARPAPQGLAAAAAAAALKSAAPSSLTGAAMLAAHFMSMTKIQTVTVCALLGAAPVVYHWQMNRQAYAGTRAIEREVAARSALLAELRSDSSRLGRAVVRSQGELLAQEAELNRLEAIPKTPLPPDDQLYAWSETSDYVRIPKQALSRLRLTVPSLDGSPGKVLDRAGNISPILIEALDLDPVEAANLQTAVTDFTSRFESLVESRTYATNSMPPGIGFARGEGTALLTLRTEAFPEEGAELKDDLFRSVRFAVGEERAAIILEKQAAPDLDNDFFNCGRWDHWLSAVPTPDGLYTYAETLTSEGTSYNAFVETVPYEKLPDKLKPYFQPASDLQP